MSEPMSIEAIRARHSRKMHIYGDPAEGMMADIAWLLDRLEAQPKLRKLEGWVEERAEWTAAAKSPTRVLVNLERDVHRLRPGTHIWPDGTVTITHHDIYVDDNARGES